jgi:hypothetical protein
MTNNTPNVSAAKDASRAPVGSWSVFPPRISLLRTVEASPFKITLFAEARLSMKFDSIAKELGLLCH